MKSIYPPLFFLAAGLVFWVWSFSYSEASRIVPLCASGTLIVLSGLDLLTRTNTRFGGVLAQVLGASFSNAELKGELSPPREVAQILWVVSFVVLAALFGIVAATAIYVLTATRFGGRLPWLTSLCSSIGAAGFIYVVFEILLSYRLFGGLAALVLFQEPS